MALTPGIKQFFAAILFGVLILIIASANPTSACTKLKFTHAELLQIDPHRLSQARFSAAFTKVSNYHRCRHKRSTLGHDKRLSRAAALHSADMRRHNYFGHYSPAPSRRKLSQRVKKQNLRFKIVAENISTMPVFKFGNRVFLTDKGVSCSFRYRDNKKPVPRHSYASLALAAVQRLMNSPGHRNNILNRRFSRTGAGIAYQSRAAHCGEYLISQDFSG